MKIGTSLLSRFAASTAALAIVVAGLAGLFSVVINGKLVRGAMEGTVRGYSESLTQHILASPDPDFLQRVARHHQVALLVELPGVEHAFDPDGETTTPQAVLESVHGFVQVVVPAEGEGRIVYSWNLRHFARLHWPLIIGHIALLFPVIGATYWFQSSQLRPLKGLRAGVESVAEGDLETRVPVVRPDEIGQVAGAFNQMTRQVKQMIADRERLLADVSHELRSPLARIKVALELLPPGAKQETIRDDVREMETLISVLLEREQLRARTDPLQTEPVDLAPLLQRVVETFGDRELGVSFVTKNEVPPAEVDADRIRLLAQNLIDNAIKFSLADSQPVRVVLESTAKSIRLTVIDDGPGIPRDERERIFKPFVKLNPARGHRTGYGLGLNLCWRIVQAHGGSIRMASAGERGNRAIVTLPQGKLEQNLS
ncbi:MAG: HAMP domain-containing sensor histidine kinase [Acidobacteriota bacterium]